VARFNPDQSAGFTLIEVLIALAIISIALTAILKSTAQNIRDTDYLQQKTIAHWVGLEIINAARAGVITLTPEDNQKTAETTMLNSQWIWEATLKSTPNPSISEINVEVFRPSDHARLANLVSYRYVPASK
jgi:general secretion pathway protein I